MHLRFIFLNLADDLSTETPVLKKKKQVHFGEPLPPEFFDKNLPPSTPLQKGGTPARAPTPAGSLQLRSVLKTPQTSESNTPHHQLELYSPSEFGASPTLEISHKRRRLSEEADGEDGKVGNASVFLRHLDYTARVKNHYSSTAAVKRLLVLIMLTPLEMFIICRSWK